MSLLLTLVAAFFVAYAMYTFHIRRQAIRKREDAGLNQVLTHPPPPPSSLYTHPLSTPILIACTFVWFLSWGF
jgi:hypothetical protein